MRDYISQRKEKGTSKGASHRDSKKSGGHYLEDNRRKSTLQKKENTTGLPETLKKGVENLSGQNMDDVKVHYNSSKPAQLNAHAYAQGKEIHLGPGQEEHLPHEAWHVVQQKKGKVKPTLQLRDYVQINDEERLEREADVMGEKAQSIQMKSYDTIRSSYENRTVQRKERDPVQLLKVDNKKITPYGETGKWLLDKFKNRLLDLNLSPHGVTKYFRNVIVQDKGEYSLKSFLGHYEKLAIKEAMDVEEKRKVAPKGTKILSWTRKLKLYRPQWTAQHEKMREAGQDIRHIIRNATIKNAIYGEYEYQKEHGDTRYFGKIAGQLGVPPGSHPWEAMKNVYKRAYLNMANLFSDGAAVNRVIGLTSDTIIAFGKKIEAQKNLISEGDVQKLYAYVVGLIQSQLNETTKSSELPKSEKGKKNFMHGVMEFREAIFGFLQDACDQWEIEAGNKNPEINSIIGTEIQDIGYNFGFDMPIVDSNPEVVGVLLKIEQELGTYKFGNPELLTKILYKFLSLEAK